MQGTVHVSVSALSRGTIIQHLLSGICVFHRPLHDSRAVGHAASCTLRCSRAALQAPKWRMPRLLTSKPPRDRPTRPLLAPPLPLEVWAGGFSIGRTAQQATEPRRRQMEWGARPQAAMLLAWLADETSAGMRQRQCLRGLRHWRAPEFKPQCACNILIPDPAEGRCKVSPFAPSPVLRYLCMM